MQWKRSLSSPSHRPPFAALPSLQPSSIPAVLPLLFSMLQCAALSTAFLRSCRVPSFSRKLFDRRWRSIDGGKGGVHRERRKTADRAAHCRIEKSNRRIVDDGDGRGPPHMMKGLRLGSEMGWRPFPRTLLYGHHNAFRGCLVRNADRNWNRLVSKLK